MDLDIQMGDTKLTVVLVILPTRMMVVMEQLDNQGIQ